MQLTQTLEQLVAALSACFATMGWENPAVVFSLTMEAHTEAMEYRAEPLTVLDGHPVVTLLREHPVAPPEAIGAALVVEGWGYSPANLARARTGEPLGFAPEQDPGRVEVRIVELCLRDGTEHSVVAERDGSVVAMDSTTGWVPYALRRVAGAPSGASGPADDLGLRIAALFQLGVLGALRADGLALPALVHPEQLARLEVPGAPGALEVARMPWWAPIEAALDGMPLVVGALAQAVRAEVAERGWCLVTQAPFGRGEEQVVATPEMLAWMDDALLVAYLDDTVPSAETLVQAMGAQLGVGWGDALARRFRSARQD